MQTFLCSQKVSKDNTYVSFIKTIHSGLTTSTKGTHPALPVVILVKSVDATIAAGIDIGIAIKFLETQNRGNSIELS